MKHDREKVIELIQETLEALDKYYQKSKIDRINTANVLYSELESAGYIAKEAPEQEPVNQKTSSTLKDEIRFNYTQEPQGTVGQVWDWQKAKWVDEKDLTPTEHSKSNYKRLDAMGFHDKLESIKRTMTQEEWDKLRTPIQEPTYEVVWGANQKISHTAGSEYIEGDGKFEVKTQEPVKPDIKWKIQSGKLDESNNLVIYELIDGYHVVKIKAEQTDGGGV